MPSQGLGRSRRKPRPTVKFLQLLPSDSFPDPEQSAAIAAKTWGSFNLDEVRHALIADAAKHFAGGTPDRHVAASRAAKRPVFEVRSHTGAAWRGAVILDDQGDPWLIWAAKHDSFHSQVAAIMKNLGDWLPAPVEFKLRDREDAAAHHLVWRREATSRLLEAVARAVEEPSQCWTCELPPDGDQSTLEVGIELEHDLPSGQPESNDSMLMVLVRFGTDASKDFIRFILPSIQPDSSLIESTFTIDSQLECWVTITQAQLAQIVAARKLPSTDELPEVTCLPISHLHYVAKDLLAGSLVYGRSTRAICGAWFVPTRDEHARLPICPECEAVEPAAQITTKLIRQALNGQG